MPEAYQSSPGVPGAVSCPFAAGPPLALEGEKEPAATGARGGYFKKGITALAVLLAIVAVISFPLLQARNPKVLGRSDLASLVSQSLQSQTGQTRVPQVTCPSAEPVRKGHVFYCTWATRSHSLVPVRVTETSDLGSFSVHVAPSAGK